MNEENGKAQIESLSQQFSDAVTRRDFEALGTLVAESMVLMPPRSEIINSKDAVLNFWRRARQIQAIEFRPQTVQPLGGEAMSDIGTVKISVNDATGQRRDLSGKYHSVWRKAADGWKLDTLIWNRTGGAQAARPGAQAKGGPFRPNRANRPAPFVSRTDE